MCSTNIQNRLCVLDMGLSCGINLSKNIKIEINKLYGLGPIRTVNIFNELHSSEIAKKRMWLHQASLTMQLITFQAAISELGYTLLFYLQLLEINGNAFYFQQEKTF